MKSTAAARASSWGSWSPASARSSRSSSLREPLVEHHQEQLLLALEVRVERALRVAGGLRDLVDRGALEPALAEQLRRRLQQRLAGALLLLAPRQRLRRSCQHHLRVVSRRLGDRPAEVRLGLGARGLEPAALDELRRARPASRTGRTTRRCSAARRPRTGSTCTSRAACRGTARGRSCAGRGTRRAAGGRDRSTGVTVTPAGSGQPPISTGSRSRRPTSEITGRSRSVSVTTASRYCFSPARTSSVRRVQLVGVADQPLDRPRECGRGGLVAGGRAVSAARRAARGRSSREPSSWRAWSSIERMSSRCSRSDALLRSAITSKISSSSRVNIRWNGPNRASRSGPSTTGNSSICGRISMSSRLRSSPRSSLEPLALLEAEHGAEDDLERDRLHPGSQPVRLAARPALDLLAGDLGHQLAVALHPLAVERGQQQLALFHVRALVEQQQRVLAEHRQQDPVGLAGVEHARVAGEHLLDVLGIGQHHPRPLVDDPERERLPEARRALTLQPLRMARPDRGLERDGHPRSRRQRSVHRTHAVASLIPRPPHVQRSPRRFDVGRLTACS